MSDARTRAAEYLREYAKSLRESHSFRGEWFRADDARAEHDELLALADELAATVPAPPAEPTRDAIQHEFARLLAAEYIRHYLYRTNPIGGAYEAREQLAELYAAPAAEPVAQQPPPQQCSAHNAPFDRHARCTCPVAPKCPNCGEQQVYRKTADDGLPIKACSACKEEWEDYETFAARAAQQSEAPVAQQPPPTQDDDLVARLTRRCACQRCSECDDERSEAAARIESDATDVRILKSVIEDLKGRYAASRERERALREMFKDGYVLALYDDHGSQVNAWHSPEEFIATIATPDSAASPTGDAS